MKQVKGATEDLDILKNKNFKDHKRIWIMSSGTLNVWWGRVIILLGQKLLHL